MKIPIYYLDAFTEELFSGNPAAVIFSDIEDSKLMQQIAAENNLSETAFINNSDNKYSIRWFAPGCEIDLCGHATLASAYIYFQYINSGATTFEVNSIKHKNLKVTKDEDLLYLDFPVDKLIEQNNYNEIEEMIGVRPMYICKGRDDYLAILKSQTNVENLNPDFIKLKYLDSRGLIVSAQGNDCDFVSRCFFPRTGVNEDPVTGSAHTSLVAYWAKTLNKDTFIARQLSNRGGDLNCQLIDKRVLIGGKVVEYMQGYISV
jgi:PhzF family phenazine biosynthesis protein